MLRLRKIALTKTVGLSKSHKALINRMARELSEYVDDGIRTIQGINNDHDKEPKKYSTKRLRKFRSYGGR